jgi:hypothetical protein
MKVAKPNLSSGSDIWEDCYRNVDPVCRLCRREGMKLSLKAAVLLQRALSRSAPMRRGCTGAGNSGIKNRFCVAVT